MRDIGIRIQRYRLQRYAKPGSTGDRARMVLTFALAGWVIYAVFLSGHSLVRIAALEHKRGTTEKRLTDVQGEVKRAEQDLAQSDDPAVVERVLRERHNFAHEGEVLYVIQKDGNVARGGRPGPPVGSGVPAGAASDSSAVSH
jgi:cell division protein FtsB